MNSQSNSSTRYHETVKIPIRVCVNAGASKNKETLFNIIKPSLVKLAALMLIVSLNWAGFSAVLQTFSFFGNTEGSPQNIFAAGVLNFELQSLADFPDVCSNEPAERTISIVNYGNPFKYIASSTEFSGEVCDYVTLQANVGGGEPEYIGPLTGFNFGPLDFSDPDDWVFKVTFNPDLPSGLLGQTCNFKFVFDGSQIKNDLPFGQGFTDTEEIVSNFTAKACCYTEIRSCGYWKTHSDVYKNHLPQALGGYPTDQIINTVTKANNVLESGCGNCGCDCDKTMKGKLKGQLLAMKFNIAHFGIGGYIDDSTTPKTLDDIVSDADNLLRDPNTPNSVLEEMKDLLDYLNNLGQIRFCAAPPDECQLQLTKTANVDQVAPGEAITYHLTFDNVGKKVCTGGGVLLKDTVDKSVLEYIDYTSTRTPKSFSKSYNYVQWNFGSIYPDDPLIEIDLEMKAASCSKCDSTITNSAKYWSKETNWGEPVTVGTQVVCQAGLTTEAVTNENETSASEITEKSGGEGPTEEVISGEATTTEETAAVTEEVSAGDENEPEQGIIAGEIIPDEPLGEPVEEPAEISGEIQSSNGQITEEAPVEETVAIEQTPAIEQQPLIAPDNYPVEPPVEPPAELPAGGGE